MAWTAEKGAVMLTCLIGYCDRFGFLASPDVVGMKSEVLIIHRRVGHRGVNLPYTLVECSGISIGHIVRSG